MSKITQKTRERCTAQTMQEQLSAVKEYLERQDARAAATAKKLHEDSDEWSDVRTAFAADARLQAGLE